MHNGLKDLLQIGKDVPSRKIGFVSLETPLPSFNHKSVDSVWLEQFTLQNATRKYLDIIGISQ
jgi:hypothetical protein